MDELQKYSLLIKNETITVYTDISMFSYWKDNDVFLFAEKTLIDAIQKHIYFFGKLPNKKFGLAITIGNDWVDFYIKSYSYDIIKNSMLICVGISDATVEVEYKNT